MVGWLGYNKEMEVRATLTPPLGEIVSIDTSQLRLLEGQRLTMTIQAMTIQVRHAALLISTLMIWQGSAHAQLGSSNPFGAPSASSGPQQVQQRTQNWKVGMVVQATGGPCAGIYGTVSVPNEWPDQRVRIIDEEITKNVAGVRYRILDEGVQQMMVSIPRLNPNEIATALVTFEVTKLAVPLPDNPSQYVLPKRPPRDIKRHLAQSPLIEVRNSRIRARVKELENESLSGWEQVQALYDWVKANVSLRDGRLKGTVGALDDGFGNNEDLTCVFIALCRASRVPARTVWVPDGCYAEFYLEDAEGEGRWFPADLSSDAFGFSNDMRPVLQRGDNIQVPEKKETQRYVAEFVKGKGGRGLGKPKVDFRRQLLSQ